MRTSIFIFIVMVTFVYGQNVPSYVSTNSLVAWYPFSGNALDSSGNGNHATYTGTGVVNSTDRFNQLNKSYDFTGLAGDYIRVPADNFPSKDRTVALWFNVPTVSNRPILLGYGGGGSLGYGTSFLMGLNILGWGSYHCQAHYNSNQIEYTYSSAPANAWHHFAVTVSGSTMAIYVDGVLSQTNTAFTYSTVVAGTDLAFGVMPYTNGIAPYTDPNGGYLQGRLDDIGFWSRALTPQEILNLYNSCGSLISMQPMNQVKVTGATANFTAVSSYTNAGYQWQMNTVSGFTPVTNGGQYAGATTSVLTVSNVSGINHGQQYRCVINAGNCVDSSAVVQLNVTNPSDIAKSELTDKVSVYPNPVSSYAFVKSDKNLSFSIISITGQRIPLDTIQKTDSNTYVLDLSMLQEGIYFMELTSVEGQSTVRKLIKLSGF